MLNLADSLLGKCAVERDKTKCVAKPFGEEIEHVTQIQSAISEEASTTDKVTQERSVENPLV